MSTETEMKPIDEVIGKLIHVCSTYSDEHANQWLEVGGRNIRCNILCDPVDGLIYDIYGEGEESVSMICYSIDEYEPDKGSRWWDVDSDGCWDEIDPDDYPSPDWAW